MSEQDTNPHTPTQEQLDKTKAETAKILEETQIAKDMAELNKTKVATEIAVAEANREKTLAETKLSVQNAEAGDLNLRQMKRQEEAALATDLFHKLYLFSDEVNERSVHTCIDRLLYWSRTSPGCNIEIIFASPGGSVFDGFILYDTIKELQRPGVFPDGSERKAHFITTGTRGMAASMAGILLQSGNVRYAASEAWVLIHEISSLAWGKSSAIEDEALFLKRIQGRVINIFVERSKAAHALDPVKHPTVLTKAAFEKGWKRKDWWLDSAEALKLGIVDEVR